MRQSRDHRPRKWRGKDVHKTKLAMGGLCGERPEKSEQNGNMSQRWKEVDTVDRECTERKQRMK